MEVIGRVGLKNSGKVFGVQRTEHWKTKLSKGNELVRGVNGVKRKEERQGKLSKVVKQKTEVSIQTATYPSFGISLIVI